MAQCQLGRHWRRGSPLDQRVGPFAPVRRSARCHVAAQRPACRLHRPGGAGAGVCACAPARARQPGKCRVCAAGQRCGTGSRCQRYAMARHCLGRNGIHCLAARLVGKRRTRHVRRRTNRRAFGRPLAIGRERWPGRADTGASFCRRSRRPGLHIRDHRQTQGCDAHACQRDLERQRSAGHGGASNGRRFSVLSAAFTCVRTHGWVLPADGGWRLRGLCPLGGAAGARSANRASHHSDFGAANIRARLWKIAGPAGQRCAEIAFVRVSRQRRVEAVLPSSGTAGCGPYARDAGRSALAVAGTPGGAPHAGAVRRTPAHGGERRRSAGATHRALFPGPGRGTA
jgi:hypothetical protein